MFTNHLFLFLTLYINVRVFLFQMHNWALVFNTFSLLLVWLGSGDQRTEILLKTNAYSKLKQRKQIINKAEDDDYEVDDIKTYFWKLTILFYEIAQVLSIFSLIMFWVFWREHVFEFYRYNHPMGEDKYEAPYWRRTFRIVVCVWSNSVTPLYMFLDFLLTKLVFRYRHVIFHTLVGLAYLGVFALGEEMIGDVSQFPLEKEIIFNPYTPLGFVGGVFAHFLF